MKKYGQNGVDRYRSVRFKNFPIRKKKSIRGWITIGRPRKISGMQTKHLTNIEKLEKENQEKAIILGREDLKKPPKWLIDNIAKKEFQRIIKNFHELEVIGNLDINNIGAYCNAYSFYLKSTKELTDSGTLTIEKQLPNGSYTLVENPLIKIQKQYAEEMRRFASLCGLTIDSRLKLSVQKTTKERQGVEIEFGDI